MTKETPKQRRERIRREREAFAKIIEKRTTAEKRRAFEKEALKVAGEKGRELARRKTFREILEERARQTIEKKLSGTRRPVRRVSTARRRPVRRVSRPQPQQQSLNISDFI